MKNKEHLKQSLSMTFLNRKKLQSVPLWRTLPARLSTISILSVCLVAACAQANAEPSKVDTFKTVSNIAVKPAAKLKPYTLASIPKAAILRKQSNYKAAMAANTENQFYFACHLLIAHKDLAKATNFARAAITTHPTWCAPYLILGNIAELSFEDDAAIVYYKKGIEAAPNCLQAYASLSGLLRSCTDYQGSMEITKEAINMVGAMPPEELRSIACELYSSQSFNFTALKQHKNAIKSLLAIDAIVPNFNRSTVFLTRAFLDDKQYNEAIELASKVLKQQPQFLEFYDLRAQAYAGLNQNQKAINDLNKFIVRQHSAISVASEDRKARTLRASLFEKTGNSKLAKIDRDFLAKEQLEAYKDTTFVGKEK
ncbi:hypothetical protein BH11CYA1_BH11CYA1_06800 [soil metagenome]